MFEDKKWSDKLRKMIEDFLSDVRKNSVRIHPGVNKVLAEIIEFALDEGYEKASVEAPDCDNCDKRMREPRINEGYL